MESIQPFRGPLSQQPPQRIDSNTNRIDSDHKSSTVHNKDPIPDVDISAAYRRKPLKHRIECGVRAKIGLEEANELKAILGPQKCQMYKNRNFSSCVVCDESCIDGEFAVETVLFIPNKNDASYDHLGRFRIELPRIACHECSAEYASESNLNVDPQQTSALPIRSLGAVWQNYQTQTQNQAQSDFKLATHFKSSLSLNSTTSLTSPHSLGDDEKAPTNVSNKSKEKIIVNNNNNNDAKMIAMEKQMELKVKDESNAGLPVSDSERDPFDDGFLICTQLVKTGGADQGGLQVGDVFVEFGPYSKLKFPGLKSIANLVRRSAGKEINVVVWRKLEQMNAIEDDGTGRTVFQKLALKLKPLQSHDADGGGVLGAVINTYPLPEMKN